MGLHGSIQVRLSELDEVLGDKFLEVGLIFGHVLLQRDDSDGWKVVLLKPEEFHDTSVVLNIGVDEDKENFALELLGGSLELLFDFLEFGRFLGDEEKVVRLDLSAEDDRGGLLGELRDEWQTVGLDP
jgi:hypothetical protein